MSGMPTIRAEKVSRPIAAEEWAIRRGASIASAHIPDAEWEKRTALAADIAEALQSIRNACNQGLM